MPRRRIYPQPFCMPPVVAASSPKYAAVSLSAIGGHYSAAGPKLPTHRYPCAKDLAPLRSLVCMISHNFASPAKDFKSAAAYLCRSGPPGSLAAALQMPAGPDHQQ